MAEYNAKLHVKTSTGYDDINLQTKAEIVEFNKGNSGLSSTNVNSAITEVNTKVNTNKTSIGTLSSLVTSAKSNLVGAINEVYNKFSSYVLKSDIINNLVSTNSDRPLSANMGKQLKGEIDEINSTLTWKTVTAVNGVATMPSNWKKAYITVFYYDDETQETIGCYGCFVLNEAIGQTNPTRLFVGGYYMSSDDYGCCWLNALKTRISLRNYVYAGKSKSGSQVDMKIRYTV